LPPRASRCGEGAARPRALGRGQLAVEPAGNRNGQAGVAEGQGDAVGHRGRRPRKSAHLVGAIPSRGYPDAGIDARPAARRLAARDLARERRLQSGHGTTPPGLATALDQAGVRRLRASAGWPIIRRASGVRGTITWRLVAITLRFGPGNASPDAAPTPLLRRSDIERLLGHFPPGATSTLRTRFGRWQGTTPKGVLQPGGNLLPSASRCQICLGVIGQSRTTPLQRNEELTR
jgi:hypothetical protein